MSITQKHRDERGRGFTLVELLVVTSIITLLSSVVLSTVNVARSKGKDASIAASLAEARNEIEIGAEGNGLYGPSYNWNLCPTSSSPPDSIFYSDTQMRKIVAGINSANNGQTTCASGSLTGTDATTWAMSSPLSSGDWLCVDSVGNTKTEPFAQGGALNPFGPLIPTAYAAGGSVPGPDLGGGSSKLAACP